MKRRIRSRFSRAAALIAALLCAAALFGCGGPIVPIETTADPAAITDNAPNPYFRHYFLNAKNRGDCRELKGKILLTFFLVSDDDSRWDTASIQKLKKAHTAATKLMVSEAASYGVTLEVSHKYIRCTVEGTFGRDNHRTKIQEVMEVAGYPNTARIARSLEKEYQVDAAPLLMCINRADRSCAVNNTTDVRGFEYAMLFGKTEDFRHELYHLFGAKDLYPKSVKALGQKYFPTSVMMDSSLVADELTAYLMGWTDAPSERAREFLDATWHINALNFKDAND